MAQAAPPLDLSSSPSPPGLARAAAVAGLATLTSRVLGLVREQVLAAMFGAGNEMDAFLVAFRVPNLVRDLFAEGAMSAAFVPTFTQHLARHGKAAAWRLGNHVLNALLLVTSLLVAGGLLFTEPLVTLYAGRFAEVPGKLELTVRLARVMLPFLTLVALAAAVMGMLNSLRHYFLPALAPATFNVVTIAFAVALTPVMPALGQPRILSLAIATLVGGVTQVALQWPSLHREGFRYSPRLDPRDPGLQRVLVLMGPGTVGLAATQLNLFVSTLLATSEGTGAVSWLQYAFRVMYLPLGLFGVSIATAVLPEAARHASAQDQASVRATVVRGLSLMLVVNVPAMCGLLVLAPDIIRLLLERGRFGAADTLATATALRYYAVGLAGYSTARIASPVFYALGRSTVPVTLSVVSVLANLAFSLWLVQAMGFAGLALATSLAALLNGALCVGLLGRQLGGLDTPRLASLLARVSVASALMSAVVAGVNRSLSAWTMGGTSARAAALVCVIAAGLLALTVAARLLRIALFEELTANARERVRKLLDR